MDSGRTLPMVVMHLSKAIHVPVKFLLYSKLTWVFVVGTPDTGFLKTLLSNNSLEIVFRLSRSRFLRKLWFKAHCC